jgi:hypothetical protein
LRLHPEFRAKVYGPKTGKEPTATGERHPVDPAELGEASAAENR